jgi:hypothetical protein
VVAAQRRGGERVQALTGRRCRSAGRGLVTGVEAGEGPREERTKWARQAPPAQWGAVEVRPGATHYADGAWHLNA